MNRVRQPFNVNNLALAAAVAALDDMEFVARSYALEPAGHDAAARRLQAAGPRLHSLVRQLRHVEIRASASARGAVFQHLLRQGVIVRPIAGYGMPEHLRVTIGLPAENERFLAALAASAEGLMRCGVASRSSSSSASG